MYGIQMNTPRCCKLFIIHSIIVHPKGPRGRHIIRLWLSALRLLFLESFFSMALSSILLDLTLIASCTDMSCVEAWLCTPGPCSGARPAGHGTFRSPVSIEQPLHQRVACLGTILLVKSLAGLLTY